MVKLTNMSFEEMVRWCWARDFPLEETLDVLQESFVSARFNKEIIQRIYEKLGNEYEKEMQQMYPIDYQP